MMKASKEKMIQFIHKNKKIFIIIFFIPFLIETAMILDTIPVMNEIKDNVAGNIVFKENDPLSKRLNYYKYQNQENSEDLINHYSLYRIFTIHSFHEGYMLVRLNQSITHENGKPVYASNDVFKITIKKTDGKWKATDIHGSLTPKFGE